MNDGPSLSAFRQFSPLLIADGLLVLAEWMWLIGEDGRLEWDD
jgi:hypothetical protein